MLLLYLKMRHNAFGGRAPLVPPGEPTKAFPRPPSWIKGENKEGGERGSGWEKGEWKESECVPGVPKK